MQISQAKPHPAGTKHSISGGDSWPRQEVVCRCRCCCCCCTSSKGPSLTTLGLHVLLAQAPASTSPASPTTMWHDQHRPPSPGVVCALPTPTDAGPPGLSTTWRMRKVAEPRRWVRQQAGSLSRYIGIGIVTLLRRGDLCFSGEAIGCRLRLGCATRLLCMQVGSPDRDATIHHGRLHHHDWPWSCCAVS